MQSVAHDIRMVMFEVSIKEDVYVIKIRLDREDLLSAVTESSELNSEGLSVSKQNALIEQYILDHFWLKFDDQSSTLRLTQFTYDRDYINVKGQFDVRSQEQSLCKISVFNSCLVDRVEKHDNIFRVNLKERTRSFRWNKDRIQTVVEY